MNEITIYKNRLLETNYFINNNYLDLYCELIYNNKNTLKEKYKTQKHHIIPRSYYKLEKLSILEEENIVNLYYKDHILAHYYICLCIKEDKKLFKYYQENALIHLLNGNSNIKIKNINVNNLIKELDEYQKLYEEFKKIDAELQIGKPAWNKGLTKETDERVRNYCKPKHFTKEHNEHNRQALIEYYKTHPAKFKGQKRSLETRKKMSLAHKGKYYKPKNPEKTKKLLSEKITLYHINHPKLREKIINYNKNRILSEESKLKMSLSQPNRKIIEVYDLNMTLIKVYYSQAKAIKELGIKCARMNNAARKGIPVAEGYYFKIIESKNYEDTSR